MEYSDEYLQQFLPREPPPFQYIPAEVIDDIERWAPRSEEENTELMARSTQWTYAMFAELQLGQFDFVMEGPPWWEWFDVARHVKPAIGLFDPNVIEGGFGLTFHIGPFKDLPGIYSIGRAYFSRLKASFPIVIEQVRGVDHRPPHPSNATSAAWAKCNRSAAWGLLTAGHAVGSRPGRRVPLTDGGIGRVARSTYPVVDAAFVATFDDPGEVAVMPVRSFPAAGHSVDIQCQVGPARRTIVKVDDNLGVVNTVHQPVLMYTDRPCAEGDSGALVETSLREAVGLYIGSLETAQVAGGEAGRVLSFEQALYALDVTAFR